MRLIFLTITFCAILPQGPAAESILTPEAVVLRADVDHHTTLFSVNGRAIDAAGGQVYPVLLKELGSVHEGMGGPDNRLVAVIIDYRLSIELLVDLQMLVGKVGFGQIRTFVSRPDTDVVSEINFGDSYEVTVRPDINQD